MSGERLRNSVSPAEVDIINNVYENDVSLRMCVDFLKSILFRNEVKVFAKSEEDGKRSELKPDFQLYVSESITPILPFAFDSLVKYGYVAYKVIKKRDKKLKRIRALPVVVEHEIYDVDIITTQSLETHIVVKDNCSSGDGLKSDFSLFSIPGCLPSRTTGKINSIVSNVAKESMYINQIQEANLSALRQRAHPPILLQQIQEANIGTVKFETPTVEQQVLKEKDAISQIEIQNFREDLHNSIAILKDVRPVDSVVDNQDIKSTRFAGARRKAYQTPEDNMFRIPPGYEVAPHQAPMPEIVGDIAAMETLYTEKVLAAFRIPMAIIFSINRHSGNNASVQRIDNNDFVVMQKTVKLWKSYLISFCEDVYKEMMQIDNKEEIDVEFDLETVPYIDAHSVYQMYNQNVIDEKSMKKRILEQHDLAWEDMATKPNIILRPPPNGSEDHTTPMMQAKLEVLRAEAYNKKQMVKVKQQSETKETPPNNNTKKRKINV